LRQRTTAYRSRSTRAAESGARGLPRSNASASSRIALQVTHSWTGTPHPQRWLCTRPESHSRLSSPTLQKPGIWPRRFASNVPPLRPLPARKSTLTPSSWCCMSIRFDVVVEVAPTVEIDDELGDEAE